MKKAPKNAAPEAPQSCGMSKCFNKYVLGAALVMSVYSFAYDWLTQGKLFVSYYAGTEHLWRPMDDFDRFFPFCILVHVLVAYLVTKGFFAWRKHVTVGAVGSCNCPYRKAMGYGMWMGIILGASWASAYIMLPIPGKLAVMWFGTTVVKWTLGGILLAKLYDWKAKNNA
jgi:hypothetical protein